MTAVARDFAAFLAGLRLAGSRTAIDPRLLAEALDLSMQEVADLTRVHRNTILSSPRSPKLQAGLIEIVRVISAAYSLTRDIDRAVFWARCYPIPALGHQTAMRLLELGRARAVIDYIGSISAGSSG